MTFQPEIHSQERAHIQRSLNDQRSPPSVRNIDTKYRSQDTREAAHDDHIHKDTSVNLRSLFYIAGGPDYCWGDSRFCGN